MSIPLVAEQRAAFRRGAVPAPRQVTDGVWSIPVPLTGSPLVSMTMYLVETAEGLVLIDAGYDDGPAWRALLAGLEATGAAPSEVRTAVLTHNHNHFHRLHRTARPHAGIISCTRDDQDLPGLAQRIHDAIVAAPTLADQFIRIVRPYPSAKP